MFKQIKKGGIVASTQSLRSEKTASITLAAPLYSHVQLQFHFNPHRRFAACDDRSQKKHPLYF